MAPNKNMVLHLKLIATREIERMKNNNFDCIYKQRKGNSSIYIRW